MEVNSESAAQNVGEGTGGDGKQQEDEDEHRRYGYKDPSIQLMRRSYIHFWGKTKGEHIGWRNYKEWKTRGKKLTNTWTDHKKTYNDLMLIMGKKVQCQLLASRVGGLRLGHKRNQGVWRTSESTMRTWMTV